MPIRSAPLLLLLTCFAAARPAGAAPAEGIAAGIEELVVRPGASASAAFVVPGSQVQGSNLAQALLAAPGVTLSGQGGLLQTFSLRGLGQERLRVLFNEAPVRSLRRAGVDGAFFQPAWMTLISVPGSAPVSEGSGALGGVLRIRPALAGEPALRLGASGPGAQREVSLRGPLGPLKAAVGYRKANRNQAADGTALNNGYRQAALLVTGARGTTLASYDASLLLVDSRDIGKSNSDFPSRNTIYPKDQHLLATASRTGSSGQRLLGHLHAQALDTRVLQDGLRTQIETRSLDWGLRLAQPLAATDSTWGIDVEGRQGFSNRENGADTLRGGRALAVDLWLDTEHELGNWQLAWGARGLSNRSGADGADTRSNQELLGHLGLAVNPSPALTASLRFSRALTWPTLSQRFLTGTTGRGGIVGNADLDEEQAWVTELALHWHGSALSVTATAFHMEVDSFIEKVALDPELDTFINDEGAELQGVGLVLRCSCGPVTLDAAAQLVRGELDNGSPVRDIPADQLQLGANWPLPRGILDVRLNHRFASHHRAVGNNDTKARTLVDLSYSLALGTNAALQLFGHNLLDLAAPVSNDNKAAQEPERRFGIALTLAL